MMGSGRWPKWKTGLYASCLETETYSSHFRICARRWPLVSKPVMLCWTARSSTWGSDGRPEFYNLMRCRSPQHFCAFDILWLNGKELRGLPLLLRKHILRQVIPDAAGARAL